MTELSVKQQFPHEELTSLHSEDKPNHASLKLLHQELNANAMATPSTQGGGAHGHLTLVVDAPTYQAIAGLPFLAPGHPGPLPVFAAAATAAQIAEGGRQYSSVLKEYQVYTAVEANLKRQLITAVPATFIDELSDEVFGFANTTTLNMLMHLDTTYGNITANDLDENLKNLHRTWSAEQPIEDLWKQIRKCRTFAAPTDPISEPTAVRAGLQNLEKSGLFTDAIRDWRKRPIHLADIIAAKYKMTTDWTGKLYCGISLKWNYYKGTVDLSIPGYIIAALRRFAHSRPTRPQHSPSAWTKPVYGTTTQLTKPTDETTLLDNDGVKRLQEIIGVLLFYARAIDSTMLVALGTLASAQTESTQATAEAAIHLLNYAATHPDATVRYHKSGMILHIHSDASYISEPKARS
jgi:hypothetical protein